MDKAELIEQARFVIQQVASGGAGKSTEGAKAIVCEFLRQHGPKSNSFLVEARNAVGGDHYVRPLLISIMEGFIAYVDRGLIDGIAIERRAQLDVVSDLLEQCQTLLENKEVHPAAPCVLIGAALEEFLRNWTEHSELDLRDRKPGIDNYAKVLKEHDLIGKQDYKDITGWAGLRNHAAHGQWEEVDDRKRIGLMLDGVNHFMRLHGA